MNQTKMNEQSEKEAKWRRGNKTDRLREDYFHGMSRTAIYKTWSSMITRCTCVTHRAYSHYGGRGISVCEEWADFRVFYKDMGDKPSPRHGIDRIDNNKGYFKENCRWTSDNVNNYNKTLKKKSNLPRGVTKNYEKYHARIRADGTYYYIGAFETAEKAGDAYLKMCMEWYGNLPPEKELKIGK